MRKYIIASLIAYFCIHVCNAQPPQKNNVNDFRSATWNTDGPRWFIVLALMNQGLDILAIQEAGVLDDISHQLSTLGGNPVPMCFGGVEMDVGEELGFYEHEWNTGAATFYLYYYDNRVENVPGRSQPKQNMAIVSRCRAEEIVVIPPEVTRPLYDAAAVEAYDRAFINRPILGILIANSIFFNIHPAPSRTSNEAPFLLNAIQNYMQQYYPDQTWMVMGDFNRTPSQLRQSLPAAPNGRFMEIVSSGRDTRSSGELDYGVIGGPATHRTALLAVIAQLLQMHVANPSDHKPVGFN